MERSVSDPRMLLTELLIFEVEGDPPPLGRLFYLPGKH